MKKVLFLSAILLSSSMVHASDEPDQTGDNLDLEGVLQLFEKSSSVEDFENRLNAEKNDVNNLDLNDDGFVDYIRVIDYAEGGIHSLTLQVPYSEKEAQDVAVILLEDQGNNSTVLQIVGDEDLYGSDYIVEPAGADEKDVVNVHHWPAVRFVYTTGYRPWVSPWRFAHYPAWYKPWKPVAWATYHNRMRHYHIPCRRVYVHRCRVAHAHYHKHRAHSAHFHAHHPHHGKSAHPAGTPGAKSPAKKSSAKQRTVQERSQPAPAPAPRQIESKPTKRPGGGNRSGGGKGGKKK